jgi:hypothetical protein
MEISNFNIYQKTADYGRFQNRRRVRIFGIKKIAICGFDRSEEVMKRHRIRYFKCFKKNRDSQIDWFLTL